MNGSVPRQRPYLLLAPPAFRTRTRAWSKTLRRRIPRQGGSVCELVRSDVIFMTTESGGAVFSVGSIAWCGSLGSNGGKNDVATATRNVLERFADPEQFGNTGGSPL